MARRPVECAHCGRRRPLAATYRSKFTGNRFCIELRGCLPAGRRRRAREKREAAAA